MKVWALLLVFFLLSLAGSGQSINDLKKKKENAEKEIQYISKLLNETQKIEKTTTNRLQLLNNKIKQRNLLISSINQEIVVYQEFIEDNNLVVEMIEEDIKSIKEEYAKLILSAYQNKNANDNIMFLLSSENFNQAHRRFLYLKRYTSFRENQIKLITTLQNILNEKIIKLESQKALKQNLIGETVKETKQLTGEKSTQNQEIQKLQKQKQDLQKKLNQQRKVEQQLEREIQRIIEEEARKSTAKGGSGFALTPEQKLVGNNFAQNKRRLPWPVERGIIVEHFGVHTHPVLKNVQIENNGINIATEIGSGVRAIFGGEVSRVFAITGGNTAVIIRHGTFLTVYSNLREVVVKKGDKVKAKQNIGTVYTDHEEGSKSILKFQIWNENKKLNPEDWIGK